MAEVPALFCELATLCCTELYCDCLLDGDTVPPTALLFNAAGGAYEVLEVVLVYETASARVFAFALFPLVKECSPVWSNLCISSLCSSYPSDPCLRPLDFLR